MAGAAHASIVGTGGKTYPITEKDMLLVIEEAIAKVDPDKLQQDIQDSFKKQLKDFRLKDAVSALPPADKDLTYRVDLSFTVSPELAQALVDVYGRSIYKAGTKVNPLPLMRKQGITYPFKLVIINADRPAELAWFKKQKLNDSPLVKLLITDGKPLELASQFKRPVYQLTQKIRERFQIQKTPSIVWWPTKSPYLAVKMFKVSEYTEEGEQHGQDTIPDAPAIGIGSTVESTSPATNDEEKELADTPVVEGHTVLDRSGPDAAFPLAGQLF